MKGHYHLTKGRDGTPLKGVVPLSLRPFVPFVPSLSLYCPFDVPSLNNQPHQEKKENDMKNRPHTPEGKCVFCGTKLAPEDKARACCDDCWHDLPKNRHGDD